ncbi:MAG: hypothetical protein L0213_09880 [Candidatus Dadabacteria bacterium]|nr:hypothetical protein [Candidatus Dadabacteria bacterium]
MKNLVYPLLSFSALLAGCFTESSLTREELAPDGRKVLFYLKDGSYIRSFSGGHHRMESGYRVAGTLFRRGGFPEKVDRFVSDEEIERFGVDEFNLPGTLFELAVAAGVITFVVVGVNLR